MLGPPVGSQASPLSLLVLALLVATGLIGVILGAYELVERTWFSDPDPQTLSLLHRLRGIFTALVVAVMVGWIVIRSSPALLAVTSVETPEPNATQRARLYAHWFIAMRWLAVLVASLLVFLSVQVFNLLDQAVWWPLLGAVALLAGFNLLYTLITPRIVQVRRVLVWQGYADLIFLTVLLHFSGGIQNPLAILMLFNVVIGGILISQKECYRMAAVGSLLFATMAIANATGFFAHHPLHLYPHPASAIAPSATLPLFVGTCVGLHTTILFLTSCAIWPASSPTAAICPARIIRMWACF